MLEWIETTLENPTVSVPVLVAAFLLGLSGAIVSAGCTLPAIGAMVGFAAKDERRSSRAALLGAGCFMLGSALAIMILGMVAGFVGEAAQKMLGGYWKLFAGVVAILFGLAALKLLPFKLSVAMPKYVPKQRGWLGAALVGLVIGGVLTAGSTCCNPGIFLVMGVVVLQGYSLWAVAILACYAVGFSCLWRQLWLECRWESWR